jgi:phage-related minor tail protein
LYEATETMLDHVERRIPRSVSGAISQLTPAYVNATRTVLAQANRMTATMTEVRSARGLFIGAVLGTVVAVALAGAGFIAAPYAVIIIMLCSALGWVEARYRGRLYTLTNPQRQQADAFEERLNRKLRAIRDAELSPERAEQARERAYQEFEGAMSALDLRTQLLEPIAIEPIAIDPGTKSEPTPQTTENNDE